MEAKDIWILIAGGIIGFVASLLATYTAPPLAGAFGKLRSGFIERNKARALGAYKLVHTLKSGKRDKYLYAINGWGMLSALSTFGLIGGAVGFAMRKALGLDNSTEHELGRWLIAIIIALSLTAVVSRRAFVLLLTLTRLENFEAYRAKLMQRWPDLELPE